MLRRIQRSTVSLCLALAVAWAGSPLAWAADAQKVAVAEALFRDARTLMQSGRFADALVKLQASQELDPGAGTLLNIAECFERLGRTASAWAKFTEAQQLAQRTRDKLRERAALERARELEPRLVKLQIVVTSEPAEQPSSIELDGTPVGTAIFGVATAVDPGNHRVVARGEGKRDFEITVAVTEPGATVTVEVPPLEPLDAKPPSSTLPPAEQAPSADLTSPAAPPASLGGAPQTRQSVPSPQVSVHPLQPIEPDRSSSPQIGTATWILGGAGLLGIAVGAGYGISAWSAWDDAKQQGCADGRCPTPAAQHRAEVADERAGIANGGFLVGGILLAGAAGVYWFIDSREAPAARLSWRVALDPENLAASASYEF